MFNSKNNSNQNYILSEKCTLKSNWFSDVNRPPFQFSLDQKRDIMEQTQFHPSPDFPFQSKDNDSYLNKHQSYNQMNIGSFDQYFQSQCQNSMEIQHSEEQVTKVDQNQQKNQSQTKKMESSKHNSVKFIAKAIKKAIQSAKPLKESYAWNAKQLLQISPSLNSLYLIFDKNSRYDKQIKSNKKKEEKMQQKSLSLRVQKQSNQSKEKLLMIVQKKFPQIHQSLINKKVKNPAQLLDLWEKIKQNLIDSKVVRSHKPNIDKKRREQKQEWSMEKNCVENREAANLVMSKPFVVVKATLNSSSSVLKQKSTAIPQ